MQKNWYIIYTKPGFEKRVATSLSRHKIENYIPVCYRQSNQLRKVKSICESLFKSYVFVRIHQDEIKNIQKLNGVVNFVFWKKNPIVVPDDEIVGLKEFLTVYRNVRIEKIAINPGHSDEMDDQLEYIVEGNLIKVKNVTTKLRLSSIGAQLVSIVNTDNLINREIAIQDSGLQLQS